MSARRQLDIDRTLSDWLDAEAAASGPPPALDRVAAVTARRRQRPTWLAVLHDDVRRRALPVRSAWGTPGGRGALPDLQLAGVSLWVVLALLLAAAVLGLSVGTFLLRRAEPVGPRLLVAGDEGLAIAEAFGTTVPLTHDVPVTAYEDPRWSPSGDAVSAFIKGSRELRVFDAHDGSLIGDTHGVNEYRWTRLAAAGNDALLVRQGSVVQLVAPDLTPRLSLEVGVAAGKLDVDPSGTMVVIAVDRELQVIRLASTTDQAPVGILSVTPDSVRRLAISPDGSWVAVLTADCPDRCDGLLRLVSTSGGEARVLDTAAWPGSSIDWSPDGSSLLAVERSAGGLQAARLTVSGDRQVIDLGAPVARGSVVGLQVAWDRAGDGYLVSEATDVGSTSTSAWHLAADGTIEILADGVNGIASAPRP
jgi:hypothetical protein